MFYIDVPEHRWLMIGSQSTGLADGHSDWDVVLRGPTWEDLEHPFFADFLKRVEPRSVANGGMLDLMLAQESTFELTNVFDRTRGIAARKEVFDFILERAIPMHPAHFARALAYFSNRCPMPLDTKEQFEEHERKKRNAWVSFYAPMRKLKGPPNGDDSRDNEADSGRQNTSGIPDLCAEGVAGVLRGMRERKSRTPDDSGIPRGVGDNG
jgi:hypothetical protein